MDRATGRMMLLVGAVVYAVFLAFQLLSLMNNAGIFNWSLLGILAQIALALPVFAYAVGNFRMPIFEYSAMLAGFVAVMAMAGYLGVPAVAGELARQGQVDLQREIHDLEIRRGSALRRLDLEIERASTAEESKRTEISKKIDELGKELSENDRTEIDRRLAALRLRTQKEDLQSRFNAANLYMARQMNGFVILGAFLMVVGSFVLRDTRSAALLSPPTAVPPPPTPAAPPVSPDAPTPSTTTPDTPPTSPDPN